MPLVPKNCAKVGGPGSGVVSAVSDRLSGGPGAATVKAAGEEQEDDHGAGQSMETSIRRWVDLYRAL